MKRCWMLPLLLCAAAAQAEIVTKDIEYKDGDVTLQGYLAYDSEKVTKDTPGVPGIPGVLIVHQWMGLTDYEQKRAKMLARQGYIAFALDIYGRDDRPASRADAPKYSGKYKSDRQLFRKRLNLGLEQFRKHTPGSKTDIAAIGYCFGGTGVLELARSGADVKGVVSFHGGLDSPTPDDGANIKCKILICHGADDPFVPEEGVKAMIKEFNDHNVDWQMIAYSNAVHSFTQKQAGTDKSKGAAYDEQADKRSWQHMKVFFRELFKGEQEK